jgi:hypothetical protein
MNLKMTIIEQHVKFVDHDTEPEISYVTIFPDNEYDSIEDIALMIQEILGSCELDCLTPDSNSCLQSVYPETDCGTGTRIYYQAFPELTVPQWEQLLAILAAWGLINWTPHLPANVIPLKRRA